MQRSACSLRSHSPADADAFAKKGGESSMPKNEKTSKDIGSIASKGLRNPGSLTKPEIKKISGSVLTQRPDKKK